MNSLLSKMQLDIPNHSSGDIFPERTKSLGEQLKYVEVSRRVCVVAGYLIERGLDPKEVTALVVTSNIWYPII